MSDRPDGFSAIEAKQETMIFLGPLYANDSNPNRYGFRIEDRHCNWRGTLHGGIISYFADRVLIGSSEHAGEEAVGMVTASLTVDFIGRAVLGDWIDIEVVVRKVGGKMAFADCLFTVEKALVARASAVFSVLKRPASNNETAV